MVGPLVHLPSIRSRDRWMIFRRLRGLMPRMRVASSKPINGSMSPAEVVSGEQGCIAAQTGRAFAIVRLAV